MVSDWIKYDGGHVAAFGVDPAPPERGRDFDGRGLHLTGCQHAYFGSGIAIALVASAMAIMPRTPNTFSFGVLAYAFTNGLAYAALCSFGNLPVVYMTALDGWVHDRFGTAWMLHTDALSGMICIVVALVVFQKINAATRAASRPV